MVIKKYFLCLLLLTLFVPSMAQAKKSPTPGRAALANDDNPGIQFLIKSALELDLTNEQKSKIKSVLEPRLDKMGELQDKAIDSMENYLRLSLKPNVKREIIAQKGKEAHRNYEILRVYQFDTWFLVKQTLTEAQLQELSERTDSAFGKLAQKRAKKPS